MLQDLQVRSISQEQQAQPYELVLPTRSLSNSMATTGGVLGIVGLPVSWIPLIGWMFGIPLGILAIIFGAIGIARANTLPQETGKSMAIAGLVLGIVTVALKLIPSLTLW